MDNNIIELNNLIGEFSLYALIILIIVNIYKAVINRGGNSAWKPITFYSLIFIYYTIVPYYWGNINIYGINVEPYVSFVFVGSFLMYAGICLGFKIRIRKQPLRSLTNMVTLENKNKIALWLTAFALICYVPFRGLQLSIFAGGDATQEFSNGGVDMYMINMISLLTTSCCLFMASGSKKSILFLLVLWITVVIYIVGGFRYRLVVLIISMATVWHLYPLPKKINYKILIPLALMAYLFFAVMDTARDYSRGLHWDKIENIETKELLKGSGENSYVFSASALVMKYSSIHDYVYLEPIWCAITMPIPRAIYPDKPSGEYGGRALTAVFGQNNYGAAFINYTEAYMSFGWLGVIFSGLFLGFLSRLFWDNYIRNKTSIGAILLLALYNGMTYVIISRGYFAQVFTLFVFYVFLPFWIVKLIIFSQRFFSYGKYR